MQQTGPALSSDSEFTVKQSIVFQNLAGNLVRCTIAGQSKKNVIAPTTFSSARLETALPLFSQPDSAL
jgi:hypothetical protein